MGNTDTPANKLISTIRGMGDRNPDNPEEVVIDDCVLVHLINHKDSKNAVGIKSIEAVEPGKGHGSRVLEIMIKVADELGVNLWVDIRPPVDESAVSWGVNIRRLIDWYKRYGFCEDRNSGLYVRYAKGTYH